MVLSVSEYNAAYFGDVQESGGLRHDAGYSNYLEQVGKKTRFDEGKENEPYNPELKSLMDKIKNENLSNVSVLDIGGAVGFHAEYGKKLGVKSWTVLDLNINGWCERHKTEFVDNYISGNVLDVLPTMRNNEYDVIFSSRFLECIDESNLLGLIDEMNRVSKSKQIHVITENANPEYYTSKPLSWWADLPFESGTILINYGFDKVVVI